MSQILLLKYLSVIISSALKFVAGPLTALALGLTWYEAALCSAAGMMVSVLTFTYVGKGVQVLIKRWRKTPAKRFSKSSRLAVRIWKRFGIIGIAILTPLLFTPIGGTIIAVAFRVPRREIFLWMLISGLSVGSALSFAIYKLYFLKDWLAGFF
ncbi:hypothetical protein [Persicitalea jodogahamensis]|uniref:Small multi-drug export protein n=1 Tax=Persicitalea jodogahamensis TaxID=402147 RepID=A0A8J3D9B7_9BACT|nr:hypothetical protein [Persicitalea jodogahamensis]GHB69542.1 hypothetical protein GCM10007390_23930 [Persicitalea jodogahamensis]